MDAHNIGTARQQLHDQHPSRRLYPDRTTEHRIGAKGEVWFGKRYNLPVDTTLRKSGDGGVDFDTAIGTIDVQTSRINKDFVLVKASKIPRIANIVVFLYWDESADKIIPKGWIYGYQICNHPIVKIGDNPTHPFWKSHAVPVGSLYPIESLDKSEL